MEADKLRRKICYAAAQLLNTRQETRFVAARWRAARAITSSYVDSESLPTDLEIRMALQQLVSTVLPAEPLPAESYDQFSDDDSAYESDLSESRFDQYLALLEPMDRVRLNRDTHPEGDLLYHSLQVFELAKDARPWDEDFLIAALLHDVGKGIDPFDNHTATLNALHEIVSPRAFWFVENLPTQHRLYDGTIGVRARRRLTAHEDGEELKLLARCDSEGRVPGRPVSSLEEVICFLRELAWE